MRIDWTFDSADIEAVKKVVEQHSGTEIVRERNERNLAAKKTLPTQEDFWQSSVHAVMTSVQRYALVEPFLESKPFPLSFSTCADCNDLKKMVTAKLGTIEGLRFKTTKLRFICANFHEISSEKWNGIKAELRRLVTEQTKDAERHTAGFISDRLSGVGPKQSRNMLQMLGLTRYEIPIDSRIMNWMMSIGCPMPMSAAGLSDPAFYEYILDKFQTLCEKADVVPCVLEGAIWEADVKKKRQPSAS